MTRTLPVELLDQILADSLEDADLASCCLASRSLLARARPRLYAAKDLEFNLEKQRASSETLGWCATIQTSPQVAALVRRVHLDDWLEDDVDFSDGVALVVDVLNKCINLEHLFLYPDAWTPDSLLIDLPMRANVLRTLWCLPLTPVTYHILAKLPNLVHLDLCFDKSSININDLGLDAPTPSFHLETLSVGSVYDQPDPAPVVALVLGSSYASIRSLKLDAIRGDPAPVNLGALSAVDGLWMSSWEDEPFCKVMSACDTVTTLVLGAHLWHGLYLSSSSLEVLPTTLRNLFFDSGFAKFGPGSPVVSVGRLLDALPRHVRLDKFGLRPSWWLQHSTPPGNAQEVKYWEYERDTWRELEAYCASRGIELVVPPRTILPSSMGPLHGV